MDYRLRAQEFLGRSRMELERLASEMRTIGEIVRRLEALLEDENVQEVPRNPTPAAPPPAPPSPTGPSGPGIPPDNKKDGLIPVGEVALALLRERGEAMSLDELFRAMEGRPDVAPSRDLKNAIRVALIRRRPLIVSERRGWFRYAGEEPPLPQSGSQGSENLE
ncbi:MAG: hypothetical protein M1313_02050 [Nitrospirae bacterium]|nr:hypothetical protein [Nitrospirota bacterium]